VWLNCGKQVSGLRKLPGHSKLRKLGNSQLRKLGDTVLGIGKKTGGFRTTSIEITPAPVVGPALVAAPPAPPWEAA
jgi:hypothetical protein